MKTTRWILRSTVVLVAMLGLARLAFAEERVPDVVGLTPQAAASLLEQAGYTSEVRFDAAATPGRVASQQPLGFAVVDKGATIVLTVGGSAPEAAPARATGSPDAPAGLEPDPFDLPTGAPATPNTAPAADSPIPDRATPDSIARDRPAADTPSAPAQPAAPSNPSGSNGGLGLPPGFEDAPTARRNARRDLLPTPPAEATGTPGEVLPGSRPAPASPGPTAPAPSAPRPVAPTGPAPYGTIPPAVMPLFEGRRLPATIGRTEAEARSMLSGWGIKIESAYSVPSLAGTVLNQWPVPGRKLAEGELVHIVLAIAEAPAAHYLSINSVVGLSPGEAVRVLRSEDLEVELYTVPSDDTEYGRVVRQSPMAGSVLPRRSNVRVYIGRGSTERAVPAPAPMLVETGREPVAPGAPGSAFDPTLRPGQVVDRRDLGPVGPEGSWAPDRPVPPTLSPIENPTTGTPPLPPREGVEDPLGGSPPSVSSPPPTTNRETTTPARPPVETGPRPQPTSADVGIPVLLAPAAGESYPKEFGSTFEWTAVRGASEYAWELQMELPTGAWRNVTRKSATSPNLRPGAMAKGRYRWRVRAIAGSKVGGWSEWFRLYLY